MSDRMALADELVALRRAAMLETIGGRIGDCTIGQNGRNLLVWAFENASALEGLLRANTDPSLERVEAMREEWQYDEIIVGKLVPDGVIGTIRKVVAMGYSIVSTYPDTSYSTAIIIKRPIRALPVTNDGRSREAARVALPSAS